MSCSCDEAPIVVPLTHVFSARSYASPVVVQLTAPIPLAGIRSFMIRWRVANATSYLSVGLNYRIGDDLLNWAADNIGSYIVDDDGWQYAVQNLATVNKQFVQFGVDVRNVSGQETYCESGRIEMIITPVPA